MAGPIVALATDPDAQVRIASLRELAVLSGPRRRDDPIGDEFRLKLERHRIECTFRLVETSPNGIQRELVVSCEKVGCVTIAYAIAEMFGFSEGRGGRAMDLPHPRWHVISEIVPGGRETWQITERL